MHLSFERETSERAGYGLKQKGSAQKEGRKFLEKMQVELEPTTTMQKELEHTTTMKPTMMRVVDLELEVPKGKHTSK